jgi:hypothetical protein
VGPIHSYDAALKRILTRFGSVVLRGLTGAESVQWLNVELHRRGTLRCDLLGRLAGGRLLHIELQGTNDSRMWVRMGTYGFLIAERFGEYPMQIVVYVGKPRLRMGDSISSQGLNLRFELVDIRRFDTEALLESPHPGDNVLAILTDGGANAATVRRVLAKIAAAADNERKEALAELATVAGLRNLEPVVLREVKHMPINLNMMDHGIFGPLIRKGMKEGLEKGLEKGRELGLKEGQLTLLLNQAERRFGTLPVRIRKRLEALDPAALQRAGLRLLDASRPEDLLAP